jgi:hypothetical protein
VKLEKLEFQSQRLLARLGVGDQKIQVNKTILFRTTKGELLLPARTVRLTPLKFYDGSDHNKYLVLLSSSTICRGLAASRGR